MLEEPADPLRLDVRLSNEGATTALMASNGGTLTAIGPDGTKYTLEVPEGALYAPVKITITPSAEVGGLPFGAGSTFAVQLEPAGLRFSDVALLTIEPSRDIPIEQQVFFTYQGDDNEFYLTPPVVDSSSIQIPIFHFSGYGVSKGLEADLAPVRKRIGGDVEARLESIVAKELGPERLRQLLGGESDFNFGAFLTWMMKTWYTEVLKPRLDAAEESCAAGQLAMQTLLSMDKRVQLLGQEAGVAGLLREAGMAAEANRVDDVYDLMKRVGLVCLEEEYELCRDEHIIHRIVPVALTIGRWPQAVSSDTGLTELLEKGREYATRCLRFRLEFESNLEANLGGMTYDSDMTSTVKLALDWDRIISGDAIRGNAPLVNESFTIHMPNCTTVSANRVGSTFRVAALTWDVGFRGRADRIGDVADLDLSFSPGITSESYRLSCSGGIVESGKNGALWSGGFGMLLAKACGAGAQTATNPDQPPAEDVSPEMSAALEAMGLSSLSAEQSAAVADAMQSGGELTLEQIQGLLSSAPSTSLESAPAVGGLITLPTAGGCAAGRGWAVYADGDKIGTQEWDRSSGGIHDEGSFTLYHTPG